VLVEPGLERAGGLACGVLAPRAAVHGPVPGDRLCNGVPAAAREIQGRGGGQGT
jgi:hypothetical protein